MSDRVLKAALDRPRLSAWVDGKMATKWLVHRRTAEGACLAQRGRKAAVASLYCDKRVRVSSRVEEGQLVAGCRRAPLVLACDDKPRADPSRCEPCSRVQDWSGRFP